MFDYYKFSSGQFKKNYNVPWPDTDYYNKPQFDLPKEIKLNNKTDLCGYIDIDGKIYKCNSCEHSKIVKDIVYDNPEYFKKYRKLSQEFYKEKPTGMLQEEYFLMKLLGFVKISSFEYEPLDKIMFRYKDLTYKQIDIIYPK